MGTADRNVGHDGRPAAGGIDHPMTIDLTESALPAPVTPGSGTSTASAGTTASAGAGQVEVPRALVLPTVPPPARPGEGLVAARPEPLVEAALPEPGSAPVPAPPRTPRLRRREDWLGAYGVQPLLVACDLAAAVSGGLLAGLLTSSGIGRVHALFVAVLLALLSVGHLYRSRLSMSILDDLPRLVGRWLGAISLTILIQVAFTRLRWDLVVVKWNVVAAAACTLAFLIIFRAVGYGVVRRLRRERRVVHRTLILGAGRVGAQVADVLLDHAEYGLHPIGFLDSDPWLGPKELPLPILGSTDALYHVLTDHDVNNVVVAFGSMRESAMVDVIRTCDRLDTEIFIVPRLFELHHVNEDMESVWGLPLVRLRRAARRSRGWRVKRVFDIALSSMALLLLSPIMLLVALAVRLEGGPGIIFRQERVGVDGRRFQVMKFRSLKPVDETESQTNWNIAHDDRLGPVGKFLRKSSIDELPQLINILKGEMSIVGPRPERPHFVDQFCEAYPRYVARHRVPSGLTGWAQVHGLRGDTSIADRARFDNYYIENWSLWLDVKIILRTVGSVLRGDGG
ncbi:MAG: exopolysaccharide biosynthesis polyprenyl glycosylphosphotransferase [Kineosporiaceae bacterium]|nr:exopolysaccharide biosynthesis polyprenyl glycosylphosphotransferase [Kineosporiaceae bacterium]